MKTLREQFIAGLTKMGYENFPSRSSKFIVMHRPGGRSFLFIGKSGSLRISSESTVNTSTPLSSARKTMILGT